MLGFLADAIKRSFLTITKSMIYDRMTSITTTSLDAMVASLPTERLAAWQAGQERRF
jgi:hypothetical protein